jgi:hypothetical protein
MAEWSRAASGTHARPATIERESLEGVARTLEA